MNNNFRSNLESILDQEKASNDAIQSAIREQYYLIILEIYFLKMLYLTIKMNIKPMKKN